MAELHRGPAVRVSPRCKDEFGFELANHVQECLSNRCQVKVPISTSQDPRREIVTRVIDLQPIVKYSATGGSGGWLFFRASISSVQAIGAITRTGSRSPRIRNWCRLKVARCGWYGLDRDWSLPGRAFYASGSRQATRVSGLVFRGHSFDGISFTKDLVARVGQSRREHWISEDSR